MMKYTFTFLAAILLTTGCASSPPQDRSESYVKIGEETIKLCNFNSPYFTILHPVDWSITPQSNSMDWAAFGMLAAFDMRDNMSNLVFEICISPKDDPLLCGCSPPELLRVIADSTGNQTIDYFHNKKAHARKMYGKRYYLDIHGRYEDYNDLQGKLVQWNPFLIDTIIESAKAK